MPPFLLHENRLDGSGRPRPRCVSQPRDVRLQHVENAGDVQLSVKTPEGPVQYARDSRARAIRRRRNAFRTHPALTESMSRPRKVWAPGGNVNQEVPADLAPLIEWFERQDDARERFRWALRDSLSTSASTGSGPADGATNT